MFNVSIHEYFSVVKVFIVCICNTAVWRLATAFGWRDREEILTSGHHSLITLGLMLLINLISDSSAALQCEIKGSFQASTSCINSLTPKTSSSASYEISVSCFSILTAVHIWVMRAPSSSPTLYEVQLGINQSLFAKLQKYHMSSCN